MFFSKGGNNNVKAVYNKRTKKLTITKLDETTINFIKVVGGRNVRKKGKDGVIVNVQNVPDVETALGMIEIVTEVQG